MDKISDKILLALINGHLEAEQQAALTKQLEEDKSLQQRLEELVNYEQLSTVINDYLQAPQLNEPEPQEVGKFKLLKKLGAGGMGTVYLAEDKNLNRHVAIKLISPAFRYSPKFQKQFNAEAELAAQLDHPSIVPLYECANQDGQPYIVMKFIDGQNLEQQLRTDPPLSPEIVCQIIRQICSAVDYAHQQGLLHCDIKPSNILLDQNQVAYLSDFGISRLMQDKAQTSGTPAYQAPETQAQPHDQSTDLYALGKVISELSHHYRNRDIEKLIQNLCSETSKERQLGDYPNIHPDSPKRRSLLIGLSLFLLMSGALITIFHFTSRDSPQRANPGRPLSLNTLLAEAEESEVITLNGHYTLDHDLHLKTPTAFIGDGKVTITTEGQSFQILTDVQFEGITFHETYRHSGASLFEVSSQHMLSFDDCRFQSAQPKVAYQIGHPLIGLSEGSQIKLDKCEIHCPGSIAIGSYPTSRHFTDQITITATKVQAEVCFFRARSGGNTRIKAKDCHFTSTYFLSQNARSGQFHTKLENSTIQSEHALFLLENYPADPAKTLLLRTQKSQLSFSDHPWLEQGN